MAEELAVLTAANRIDQALQRFVHNRAEAKVVVVKVNEWGHLHAAVATHGFEGVPQRERQELVWDYLRNNVQAEDLAHLYRVEAMSANEYDARVSTAVFEGGITSILRLGSTDQDGIDE